MIRFRSREGEDPFEHEWSIHIKTEMLASSGMRCQAVREIGHWNELCSVATCPISFGRIIATSAAISSKAALWVKLK